MHYITSLSMQLEGKERSVLTEFYPQQNRKLSETKRWVLNLLNRPGGQ
jgi:hypothetical protein